MTVIEEIRLRPRRINSSINKLYLKENIQSDTFTNFSDRIKKLFKSIPYTVENKQGEEYLKTLLRDFLLESFYKENNFINTMSYKGRNEADLVIHSDKNNDSNVSVIFEVKTPKNISEMISKEIVTNPSVDLLLKKSFSEAVLYFLWEYLHK